MSMNMAGRYLSIACLIMAALVFVDLLVFDNQEFARMQTYALSTQPTTMQNRILSTIARLNARLAAKMQAKLTKPSYSRELQFAPADVPIPLPKADNPRAADVSKYEAVDYASTMASIQSALKKLEAARDKTLGGLKQERAADLKHLNSEIARQAKIFRAKARAPVPIPLALRGSAAIRRGAREPIP